MRALERVGLAILGLAALAGVFLSAAFLVVSTEAGRSLLVPRLVALANREIRGRIELEGFSVGATGRLELRGLRLLDPAGRPVISVRSARGQVDLSRLRSRRISLRLEVDGAGLSLEREPGGPWSLEEALAPARPRPPEPEGGPFRWTLRLARLSLRGGEVLVRDGAGERLRARDLTLEARAIYGPRGGRAEVRLGGRLLAPVERPLSLEAAARASGNQVSVPFLRAALGQTALDLAAEGAPAARQGRAALLALSVDPAEAEGLAPGVRLGALSARAYLESNGRIASAALETRPAGGGGSGDAAAAVRLPPAALAAGIDLRLDGLDPARAAAFLPPGELHLEATGHVAGGAEWRTLRGALRVSAAPSRLRGGRFGPVEVAALARDGALEVSRLEAALPGASLSGQGSWRPRGAVSGRLAVAASDLGTLARDLSDLSGQRLPRLGGSGRIEAALSGTAAAPEVRARLAAAQLRLEDAAAQGVSVDAGLEGPSGARQTWVEVRAARLSVPGSEARDLSARARLVGQDADVRLSLVLPQAGPEPFALRAGGRLAPDRRSALLSALEVSWPGTRFALAAPARLDLVGPGVDRLEVASGPQRLALEGGLSRGALDLRARGEALELERIPPALLPADLGLRGRLSFSAEAQGRPPAPKASARIALSALGARGLEGIEATAELRVDGPARRAAGTLAVRGLAGASLDATADLPLDLLRPPPSAPISVRVEMAGLDLAGALRAAGVEPSLEGRLSMRGEVGGTAGTPALRGSATWEDARFAGGAAGRLELAADVSGPASAPRGRVEIAAGDAALAGWRELGLDAALVAGPGSTSLSIRARSAGREVLSAQGEVSLPPERLRDRAAIERAPLRLSAEARGVDLARIPGPVELAGSLDLETRIAGRLAAPEVELEASAGGLAIARRPVGDLSVRGRARGREVAAEASLRPPSGGRAEASLKADVDVAAGAISSGAWRTAPARARLEARGLDLSFLAAVAPGLIRSASGTLEASLEAQGPLADLRPTGSVRVAGGRASAVGAGEWHGIELAASLDEDQFRLSRLAAHHGEGSLEATATVSGLRRPGPAELQGELHASALTVSRYGQDLAILDLAAQLRGQISAREAALELTIPSGTARLPDRSLRPVQSLEPRPDVVVEARSARPAAGEGPPLRASVRLVLPGHFLVKRRDPRVDAELRGEVTFTAGGGGVEAEGRAELVRGSLDLYGNGRTFDLRRASTTFDGPVERGVVDGEAVAQFPDHLVKVTLGGTVGEPTIKLTSEPALDEGRIAMLIATGRTEGRAGAGAAGTLTGEQAGYAVLGVFATKLLRDALQDKLPVDSVALEPGQIRAGKYLSDKVYLDYVHRSAANPELGENANEVRVEYQVGRRWTLETRYGDANAGSASLIWTKDY